MISATRAPTKKPLHGNSIDRVVFVGEAEAVGHAGRLTSPILYAVGPKRMGRYRLVGRFNCALRR